MGYECRRRVRYGFRRRWPCVIGGSCRDGCRRSRGGGLWGDGFRFNSRRANLGLNNIVIGLGDINLGLGGRWRRRALHLRSFAFCYCGPLLPPLRRSFSRCPSSGLLRRFRRSLRGSRVGGRLFGCFLRFLLSLATPSCPRLCYSRRGCFWFWFRTWYQVQRIGHDSGSDIYSPVSASTFRFVTRVTRFPFALTSFSTFSTGGLALFRQSSTRPPIPPSNILWYAIWKRLEQLLDYLFLIRPVG